VAGLFTTNRVQAAPVRHCRHVVARGRARAVVINSGNANACTGPRGERDAEEMARLTADSLGLPAEEVLVASTGIIGEPLPMSAIREGIRGASAGLKRSGTEAALAILTTDSFPKVAAAEAEIGGVRVRIGGMAKGAGMIHPRLATTLCFLATDAPLSPGALDAALRAAVSGSFNRITVDGDMSTNDTVILLANGAAGGDPIDGDAALERFQAALSQVTSALAEMVVRDGEGATRVARFHLTGAASDAEAERGAYRLAGSLLVKTALHGGEPNWGRMMAALGSAGIDLAEDRVQIFVGPVQLVRGGLGVTKAQAPAAAQLDQPEIDIRVDLGLGSGEATVLTCDLSEEYIRINGSYAAERSAVS
jgi:glutamate N-acetyltransferase/amino-acid N-acetyltransferase